MQKRMKDHPLTSEEVRALLLRTQTGALATLNPDGTPYNVPVHYAFAENAVYLHGLPAGQKIDNLKQDPHVCLTVWEMQGLLLDPDERPCNTNTAYHSVVINGTATFVADPDEKRKALSAIVRKYTPHLAGRTFPDNMLRGTAVIKISIDDISGKYYS